MVAMLIYKHNSAQYLHSSSRLLNISDKPNKTKIFFEHRPMILNFARNITRTNTTYSRLPYTVSGFKNIWS